MRDVFALFRQLHAVTFMQHVAIKTCSMHGNYNSMEVIHQRQKKDYIDDAMKKPSSPI